MDSLYSAFIIEAGKQRPETWELFTYARSRLIPCTNITARDTHTNVPRGGDSGLPMNWFMQVDRWRAGTNLRFLTDDVLEWAAETSVQLQYNHQPIATTPFSDLLLSPHPLANPNGGRSQRMMREANEGMPQSPLPFVLRENINFRVQMVCPQSAIDQLSVFLVENSMKLAEKRESLNEKMNAPRLIGWIWLEGALSRSSY